MSPPKQHRPQQAKVFQPIKHGLPCLGVHSHGPTGHWVAEQHWEMSSPQRNGSQKGEQIQNLCHLEMASRPSRNSSDQQCGSTAKPQHHRSPKVLPALVRDWSWTLGKVVFTEPQGPILHHQPPANPTTHTHTSSYMPKFFFATKTRHSKKTQKGKGLCELTTPHWPWPYRHFNFIVSSPIKMDILLIKFSK